MIKEILYNSIFYKIFRKVYAWKFKGLVIDLNTDVRIRALKNNIIEVGNDVVLGEYVKLSGKVRLGEMTYLSSGMTDISAEQSHVNIGRYCSIASNCFIRTSAHFLDRITTSPRIYSELFKDTNNCETNGPVIIEDDVWIGANVTILGGVTIGRGAIIGAGSVVIKNVAPYCIYAGNPARMIKVRFSDRSLAEIEKIKLLNLSQKDIIKNKNEFYKSYN